MTAIAKPRLIHKIGILSLLGYAYLITVVRAVQLPIGYGQVHWLLDYRFGFVKRAVPGAILNALGLHDDLSTSFATIMALSVGFLALLSFLVLWLCYRIIIKNNYSLSSILLAVLLVTSPFILYAGLLIGYFDSLVQAVAILLVYLVMKKRLLWVAVLQVPLMLTHEMYLLVGFPVVLFTMWLTLREDQTISRWHARAVVATPLLAFFIIFTWSDLSGLPEVQHPAWDATIAEYTYIREDYRQLGPALIIFGFGPYLSEQASGLPFRIVGFPAGVMLVCLVGLSAIWQATRKRRASLQVGVALAVIVPAGMLLIAWDIERIWTYCVFQLLLLLWVLSERGDIQLDDTLDLTLYYVIGILIAMAHPPPLMDETIDRYSSNGALLFSIYSPLLLSIFYFKPTRNLITNIFMGTRRPTHKTKIMRAGE